MSQIYLFWNDTLHVSDGFSFQHQEFKTVHTRARKCSTPLSSYPDLTKNTFFLTGIPVVTAATAVKAVCKYRDRVPDAIRIFIRNTFLIT